MIFRRSNQPLKPLRESGGVNEFLSKFLLLERRPRVDLFFVLTGLVRHSFIPWYN
jgi:hypothetical protein